MGGDLLPKFSGFTGEGGDLMPDLSRQSGKRVPWIVAIDGPAGSGKSSAARLLAVRLGWNHLDTGALYRAVAWKALKEEINLEEAEATVALCQGLNMVVRPTGETTLVYLDGVEISGEIRTPEVSRAAAAVAAMPKVRERLLGLQREVGRGAGGEGESPQGVVIEGRDIGTVVFPDAPLKFYLEASPEIRVKRRHKELQQQGLPVDLSETRREVRDRDLKDSNRSVAPLRPAEDAIRIDSSAMSLEDVVQTMVGTVRKRTGHEE